MKKFIEVTDIDTNENILIDKKYIIAVRQREGQTDIMFAYGDDVTYFSVKQDYKEIKKQSIDDK